MTETEDRRTEGQRERAQLTYHIAPWVIFQFPRFGQKLPHGVPT